MNILKLILFAIGIIAFLEGLFTVFFPKTILKMVKFLKSEEKVKKAGMSELTVGLVFLIISFNL